MARSIDRSVKFMPCIYHGARPAASAALMAAAQMRWLDGRLRLPYTRCMIDEYLFCDWDEAPDAMDFEQPNGEVIGRSADLVAGLSRGRGSAADPRSWNDARELFVLAPAIINVALNYSVCVQFGLPLHPTEYFEIDPNAPPPSPYGADMEAEAFDLLARAVALARAAYRLDPDFSAMAAS